MHPAVGRIRRNRRIQPGRTQLYWNTSCTAVTPNGPDRNSFSRGARPRTRHVSRELSDDDVCRSAAVPPPDPGRRGLSFRRRIRHGAGDAPPVAHSFCSGRPQALRLHRPAGALLRGPGDPVPTPTPAECWPLRTRHWKLSGDEARASSTRDYSANFPRLPGHGGGVSMFLLCFSTAPDLFSLNRRSGFREEN